MIGWNGGGNYTYNYTRYINAGPTVADAERWAKVPGERSLSKNAWLCHIQWYYNIIQWRTINYSGTAIHFCIFFIIPNLQYSLDKTQANSYLIGLRLKYMFIMLTVTFLMGLTHKIIALLLFQISSPSSIMVCLSTVCVSNNIKKVVWRCEIWSPD